MSDEQNNNLPETPEVKPRGFSNKKNIIIIALAAVLAIGGGVTAVSLGAANRAERSVSSGIQLAERYLSELNYTQAVIEFRRVLEIEPKNVDAYLGLAQAYIGLGDTEKALEALRQGLEITGDPRIQAMIDELRKPGVSLGSESSPASSAGSANSQPVSAYNSDIPPLERSYTLYDGEMRLEWEATLDENGIFTETAYGELFNNDGEPTGWGILDIYKEKIDENGVWRPVYDHNFYDTIIDSIVNEHIVEYTYDDRGGLIKEVATDTKGEICYSEDTGVQYGEVVSTTVYSNEYNSSGRLAAQTGTTTWTYNGVPDNDGAYYVTITYEYHANGNVTRTSTSGSGKSVSIYEYNSKGWVISGEHTFDGNLRSKTEAEYDDQDRVIRRYSFRSDGDDRYIREDTWTCTYTDTGCITHYIYKNSELGEIREWTYTDVYEYDAQGRKTGSKKYDENGVLVGYSTIEWDR